MSNVVVYFSCIAAFADSPLTPDAVTSSTVLFSLSKARRLGSAVLEARVAQTSPVAAILQQEGGKHRKSADKEPVHAAEETPAAEPSDGTADAGAEDGSSTGDG